jgi:hypothetical protein
LDGKPSLICWVIPSREFDELLVNHGFTKTDREIMLHVARRESIERGCDAGLADLAHFTRTHKDYVRHRLKYLVARGIILRVRRPGDSSVLRLVDKFTWLNANPLQPGKRPIPPPEESADEVKRKILWERIWQIPGGYGAARKTFQAMMDQNLPVFEAVVSEMENRVKRSLPENEQIYGPDSLPAVKNFAGMFVDLFNRWNKANPR